jgi:hypothetical protein
MTSTDRVFLTSLLGQIRTRVPFDVSGDFEGGELTIGNFPQVRESEVWVLQGLLEEAYKHCERCGVTPKAIRFRDSMGHQLVEVIFAG